MLQGAEALKQQHGSSSSKAECQVSFLGLVFLYFWAATLAGGKV
jgi:hypothetical protein